MGELSRSESSEDYADFVDTEFARLAWVRKMDTAAQKEFLAVAQVVQFSPDDVAQELGAVVTRVLFVVTGSFNVQLLDDLGRETFEEPWVEVGQLDC